MSWTRGACVAIGFAILMGCGGGGGRDGGNNEPASPPTEEVLSVILADPEPAVVRTGRSVRLSFAATYSAGTTFLWDFDDGTTAGGIEAKYHTYTNPGSYTLKVSAMSLSGKTASDSKTIVVTTNQDPTMPSIVVEPPNPVAGQEFFLLGNSSDADGDALAYSWYLQGGVTLLGPQQSVSYDVAGTYTVILAVDDGFGGVIDAEIELVVAEPEPATPPPDPLKTWIQRYDGSEIIMSNLRFLDAQTGFATGMSGANTASSQALLLKTTDYGATWVPVETGKTEMISAVHFTDASHGWIVGTGENHYEAVPPDGSIIYINWGTVLKTADGGATWANVKLEEGLGSVAFRDVRFADANNGWIVGPAGRIYVTHNAGEAWQAQVSNTTMDLTEIRLVDAQHVWVSGKGNLVLWTEDGGDTWNPVEVGGVSLGGFDMVDEIRDVQFADVNNGWAITYRIFGSEQRIYRTIDGARTWTLVTTSLTTIPDSLLFTDSQNGYGLNLVGGVSRTIDGGATWVPLVNSSGQTLSMGRLVQSAPNVLWSIGKAGQFTGVGGVYTVTLE